MYRPSRGGRPGQTQLGGFNFDPPGARFLQPRNTQREHAVLERLLDLRVAGVNALGAVDHVPVDAAPQRAERAGHHVALRIALRVAGAAQHAEVAIARAVDERLGLDGVEAGLRELSDIITRTQLSLPGGMQPLWGPDQSRVVP